VGDRRKLDLWFQGCSNSWQIAATQISLGRTIESFEEVLEDKVVCMTLESGVQILELWSDPKLWSLWNCGRSGRNVKTDSELLAPCLHRKSSRTRFFEAKNGHEHGEVRRAGLSAATESSSCIECRIDFQTKDSHSNEVGSGAETYPTGGNGAHW